MQKRFKIPLFGVILVAVAIIVGLVLLYQSHILENWVNRYLAEKLADKYGMEINISEIEGSFINGFTLRNVTVDYKCSDTAYTLAYLPQVTLQYDASKLWNLNWVLNSLRLEKPQFFLYRDDSGGFILPQIGVSSHSTKTPPSWEANQIIIENGQFTYLVNDTALKWYGINLNATAKSDEGTITLAVDSMRFNSDDGRLRVNYASGLATIFKKRIVLQNIDIVTDSSRISFSLAHENKDGPWTEIDIGQSHIHLPDIVSFVGSQLSGDFDIKGTIYRQFGKLGGNLLISGNFENRRIDSLNTIFHYDDGIVYLDTLYGAVLDGCDIEGFGDITFGASPAGYRLTADISGFNLTNLIFDSFSSDLNGHIDLFGRGLRTKTMAIDIDTRLDESHFDIYHFHQASGQMTITNSGLYFFPGFAVNYYENRFLCGGSVDYHGNINITGRADFADLSRFAHQTFIDLPAGSGKAEFSFTGPTNDPRLSGRFTSDSVYFYDFYSSNFTADFSIESFVKSKRGPIRVWSYSGNAWDFPYDSVYSEMILDSNLLFIDSIAIFNQFSHAEGRGILDYEQYPQRLVLDSLAIGLSDRYFRSIGGQLVSIDSSGFIFDNIHIKSSNGFIDIGGRANYDKTLDLNWDIKNVSIGPWVKLWTDSFSVDGVLSSSGRIRGPFDNPYSDVEAEIDSLLYDGLLLGNLHTFLTYDDTTLYIDSSFLKSPEGIYSAEGDFPINLTLTGTHNLFDDREQNITISARDKRLDLVAFVLESVEYMTGDFTADIMLTGKPMEPHLDGNFILKNGEIKLIDLKDKLQQVELELEMSDRLVTIEKANAVVFNGKSKSPGTIKADGTILINNIHSFTYAINVNCLRMPLNYELGDFTGLADSISLRIDGPTPPTVSGSIIMNNAYYRESFDEETGFSLLTALEADKTWNLDLMVECPSNFWTKNDDIDAEYSGRLNIIRKAGVYNFLGTLEVVRGKYFLFDKTFRMTPGGQIIYDNIEKLDPKLNLEITTRIRTQSRFTGYETEDSYSYELPLRVTGTLTHPIITVTGDAPISNENILPSILTNTAIESHTTESSLSDRITVGGIGLLANSFSRLGTRTLGVETFEINPDFSKGFDPSGTRVLIGTYTLPNLYIFGSSYFDVNKGQEIGLEYRLSRHYLFEGRRDEFNLYHFSFKFHWEY